MSPPSDTAESAVPPTPAPASGDPTLSRHLERHGWKRLVFEMFLLVASAMLALGVNDWNNERDRRQLAHRVLEELKVEVAQNRESINANLDYHERMSNGFQATLDALAKGERWEYPAGFEGLNQNLFQRSAYDAALLSQTLPHLNPGTLSALSALYTQQEEYTQNLRLYAAATLQSDDKDSRRDLRLTENCFKQMAASERRLVLLMDRASTAISAELAADS
jgi:hypothetical protein